MNQHTTTNAVRRTRLRVEPLESRDVPSLVPAGPEFRVNSYTPSSQRYSSVAMDSAGAFVVAWASFQDGGDYGIYAQRFNATGTPLGGEFQVNTFVAGRQYLPRVAMSAIGDFVIAWESADQDGSGRGVYAQRYNTQGEPQGSEFRVNSYTTGNQRLPCIGMDADGDFVIAWSDLNIGGGDGQDGSNYGIYAQRYNAAGLALGQEFRVNSYTTGAQAVPSIGMNAAGDFVISWSSNGQDGSNYGVYAQRYDVAGVAQGGEFRANAYTTSQQVESSVAMDGAGDFVIVWRGVDQVGGGIIGQRFDLAGAMLGPAFLVNTYTTGINVREKVAMNANGDFVVVWQNRHVDFTGHDGSDYGIYAQSYDASGVPVGAEFRVNTYTANAQASPGVAMDAAGNVVAVWNSEFQDGGTPGIFAQRYTKIVPPAIQSTQINSGASQRSRVIEATLTFNTQVSFVGSLAEGFTLVRAGGGSVSFTATTSVINGVTVVTLNNFTGPETQSGSLRDGRYTLTALASQISVNGANMAANYTFGDAQGLFRYYGDMNGDRRVDISDFGFFSLAYLTQANYNAALDFNNDGRIDIADFGQFSVRFFTTLP